MGGVHRQEKTTTPVHQLSYIIVYLKISYSMLNHHSIFTASEMFIYIFLSFACFGLSISQPRKCTKDDFCLPVPASVCDNSKCIPVDYKDISDITGHGSKMYTWHIARNLVNGYCPGIREYEVTKSADGTTKVAEKHTIRTGPRCNVTTSMTEIGVAEIDPATNKIRLLKRIISDDVYDACYLYVDPGVSLVYRRCRVGPLSPDGTACATVNVHEVATGNCNREKLLDFIMGLGVDFQQINSNCV